MSVAGAATGKPTPLSTAASSPASDGTPPHRNTSKLAPKSKRDVIRCLKRYVAREIFTIIKPTADQLKPPTPANLTP